MMSSILSFLLRMHVLRDFLKNHQTVILTVWHFLTSFQELRDKGWWTLVIPLQMIHGWSIGRRQISFSCLLPSCFGAIRHTLVVIKRPIVGRGWNDTVVLVISVIDVNPLSVIYTGKSRNISLWPFSYQIKISMFTAKQRSSNYISDNYTKAQPLRFPSTPRNVVDSAQWSADSNKHVSQKWNQLSSGLASFLSINQPARLDSRLSEHFILKKSKS
jgi:hypothetical protein